jgi:hypothetical protein
MIVRQTLAGAGLGDPDVPPTDTLMATRIPRY